MLIIFFIGDDKTPHVPTPLHSSIMHRAELKFFTYLSLYLHVLMIKLTVDLISPMLLSFPIC